MRYRRASLVLGTLMLGTLLVVGQSAFAGPPQKPGNPGLPGCLSEVAAKEAEIATLQAQVNALTEMLEKLQSQALVPQTGATTCYDPNRHEVPCAGTGQDGDYQMGVPWPQPRFTDNGDDTVTDNLTGLMWTRDITQIQSSDLTFFDAIDACKQVDVANYNDWRMPNVREFFSLLSFTTSFLPDGHPFLNESNADNFWTSTPLLKPQGELFSWGFGRDVNGTHTIVFDRDVSRGRVWCVRGGK